MENQKTDPIRIFIAKRMHEKRLSETFVSKELGKNSAYMNQYFKENKPRHLSEDTRHRLARILEVDEKMIKPKFENSDGFLNQKSMLKPSTTSGREFESRYDRELIPIYGRANGSGDRMIMHPDAEIGMVPSHPAQDGYKHELKFGVEIVGTSMEPMIWEGDTVYGILNQQPQKEKPCVIECDEEALVKIFIKKTEKELIYRQFNPPLEKKISLIKVKAIHAIKSTQYRGT